MIALQDISSVICGQAHVWTVGGHVLPLCQRCTGLYAGAACAMALWLAFRPRPTSGLLWCHGLALLLMVPFGYHLVPQGAMVRTLTGFVFAFGLVYFLALIPAAQIRLRHCASTAAYVAGAFGAAAMLMLALQFGGAIAASLISLLSLAGLTTLAVLSAGNLLLIPISLRRAAAS